MADKKSTKQKKIPIKRVNPENISSVHVNDMMTSHTENEFFLTFSELEPPAVLDDSELGSIDAIYAVAKLKLVISPNFARAIVKTLSENIATFDNKVKGNRDE